jgi:hypothetical protein
MAIRIERIATDWQDVSDVGTRHYVPGQTIVAGVLDLPGGTVVRVETALQGDEYQLYSELVRRICERVTREMVAGG